jgi:hypothetical protein
MENHIEWNQWLSSKVSAQCPEQQIGCRDMSCRVATCRFLQLLLHGRPRPGRSSYGCSPSPSAWAHVTPAVTSGFHIRASQVNSLISLMLHQRVAPVSR